MGLSKYLGEAKCPFYVFSSSLNATRHIAMLMLRIWSSDFTFVEMLGILMNIFNRPKSQNSSLRKTDETFTVLKNSIVTFRATCGVRTTVLPRCAAAQESIHAPPFFFGAALR